MAYVDAQTLLSDAQALTATAVSTNYINLGAAQTYLGTGEPMAVLITVDVAAGGTSPTLIATLQSDDNTSFSSAATVAVSPTFAGATLVAGYQFILPIPVGTATEQYIRLSYTVGGTTPTVTVTAIVKPTSMVGQQHYLPNAYTV